MTKKLVETEEATPVAVAKKTKVKQEPKQPEQETRYKVKLAFTEDVLGSVPKNAEIYKNYIESNKPPEQQEEEYKSIESVEERGWTTFRCDERGYFTYDYTIKGMFKELSHHLQVKGSIDIKGVKARISQFLFVYPRRIAFLNAKGKPIDKNTKLEVLERPLRVLGPMGERTCLARSDILPAGTQIEFEIVNEFPSLLTEDYLNKVLARGERLGWGQWRGSGAGRFVYKLERIE
jgi:hypothetical protein